MPQDHRQARPFGPHRAVAALSLLVIGLLAISAAPVRAAAAGGSGAPPDLLIPMAVSSHMERAGASTLLSFDLSSKLEANAYVLEGPDRIIVDLPQVNFQLDPAVGRLRTDSGALIKSFRFGLFAPGRSRIVIDLAAPAALVSVASAPIAGGEPSRLTIEIAKTDRTAFHKAALAAPVERPPAAPQLAVQAVPVDATGDAPRPVIVIDPGHGGIDPGASGLDGVVEKTLVFDFAALLVDKLKASGRYTVVMTRSDDTFVSLGDRVRIARTADAALFVSIHADTLAVNGSVSGATVYTASDRASDAEAARVASAENESDSAAGVEAVPDSSGVNDILFDLTRRETRTYAHLFQRTLVGYWQKIARLNKNPERSAGFKVLEAPDVPSVLLELGYLSSDKDVKALTSPDWRDHATSSVLASIDAFFAPRQLITTGTVPMASTSSVAAAPAHDQTAHDDSVRATAN